MTCPDSVWRLGLGTAKKPAVVQVAKLVLTLSFLVGETVAKLVPAPLWKRSHLVKSGTSSFLLSAAWTPHRENSLSCVSSGQRLSYESTSPSSVGSERFCSFSFLIFSVPGCRLLELLTLLPCRLGWALKPQAFLFPAPVRDVSSHLAAWIANTVGLWVQICFHGYQHHDVRSRRFI